MNSIFSIFKSGYCLVPAVTVFIALSHKFSFVYEIGILVRV